MTATPLFLANASGSIVEPARPAVPVLVRDVEGVPVPPSEIVERLKRIHPALGLKFSSGLAGSGWAVTWTWQENDRRRAWVQDGRMDPNAAHDIIGYLPFGCSAEQAPSYIERSFKDYPREEVSRLRERMHHWNTVTQPQEQNAAVVAEVVETTMAEKRQKNPRRKRVEVTPS